jgi:ankyrin repeat protein
MTPLCRAAYLGDSAKVDLMMTYSSSCCSGPDGARSGSGLTLLMCAVQGGHVCLIRRLCTLGASVNAQDLAGDTPLHHGALTTQLGALQYLLRSGADVNARNEQGCTPLSMAARADVNGATTAADAAVVQLLLDAGADVTVKNKAGDSVLAVAVQGGSVKIVQLLEHAGAELTPVTATELLQKAVSWHRVAVARYLLSKGAAVNSKSPLDGSSLLHSIVAAATAATADAAASVEMMRLLLSRGADVHARCHEGETALYTAVQHGHMALAEVLLAAGAEAAAITYTGWTCVSIAVLAKQCNLKMLQLLLQRGAAAVIDRPVRACSCCGAVSALMMCMEPAMLKLLLDAGVDVHFTTRERGTTALHTAAQHWHSAAVVCMLLKAGADITALNRSGHTAAQVAAAIGNHRTAALLTRVAQR